MLWDDEDEDEVEAVAAAAALYALMVNCAADDCGVTGGGLIGGELVAVGRGGGVGVGP